MRVLVAGNYLNTIYAKAMAKAFHNLGCDVLEFNWYKFFEKRTIISRFQFKYHVGPLINRLNKELYLMCKQTRPDFVFVYRGIVINHKTILKIKSLGIVVIGYNNDDPFDSKYPKYVWNMFIKSAPFYDFMFSFRSKNVDDYKKMGIQSEILRIYYIKDRNFHIDTKKLPTKKYICDIIFIGHFEDDGRDVILKKLIDKNYKLKIYGAEWKRSKYYDFFRQYMGEEIIPINDDYNVAMNSAKIVLSFLSKLNNDTYTTRCFEIPATKQFMLCEFSDDLTTMFSPNKEAVYFKSEDDLFDKIAYYLEHDEERISIAGAGYTRLIKDGHEISDRCKQIIQKYHSIKANV